jgi:excisionase family DNA binding protein
MNHKLSTQEVAKYLNLSPNTLAEWRSTGKVKIPYLKIGKIVRYSLTDVNKFLENNRLASTLDKVIDPSSVTDFKHGSAKPNHNEAI